MLRRKTAAAAAAKTAKPVAVIAAAKPAARKRKVGKGKGPARASPSPAEAAAGRSTQRSLETTVFGASELDETPIIGVAREGEAVADTGNAAVDFVRIGSESDDDNDADEQADSEDSVEADDATDGGVDRLGSRRPAWVDEDDADEAVDVMAKPRTKKLRVTEDEGELDGKLYASRLRTQFEKINGRPSWAATAAAAAGKPAKKKTRPKMSEHDEISNDSDEGSDEESEDDDTAFLHGSKKHLSKSRARLPKGLIDCTKVRDANFAAPSKAVVQAVRFHPRISALMTAGLDKTLRIFQVDGKVNRLLQSVHFPDLPIYSAEFTRGGTEIVLSGRRKFFYVYDLQSGSIRKVDEIQGRPEKSFEFMYAAPDSDMLAFTCRNGEIVLVSNRTKQWAGTLKMNGAVNAVTFLENKNKVLSSGRDGKVYLWDLRAQRCEHVFVDEGCISSTALAASRNDKFVACGSDTGVVNIYDDSCFTSANPKPLRAVMNLTTPINHLEFHPDSQILGMSSKSVKDAFRLIHLPSMQVFKNWPTSGTPLNYVNTFAFSPRGGYCTMGNDKGRSLLYRLNHYSQL